MSTLSISPERGRQLLAIAEQYGTPVYVYDAQIIERQYNRLVNAFATTRVKIKYACKANPNLNIIKRIHSLGAGIDTVSIQEVEVAMLAGVPAQHILYTPNCVDFAEIQQAVAYGVGINIDNIAILEQFGNAYGDTVPVCIRLNPHIVAGGHGHIQTGHIDSKFGISIHQIRHILRVVRTYNIRVEGLHMHTGSDILDADVFLAAAEVLFNCSRDFPDLRYLDFGSGFKVAYREGDVVTDIEALGQRIAERFNEFCQEYGRPLELWFEPGKFLVSESGYLLVRANTVKQTVSTQFVGVNSGLNHLIRPMLYDAYHHITNISNPEGIPRIYAVVGYICETDTFGWDRKLNEVREGDILALHNAGAYGFSMSSNYNCRLRPAEVLIWHGEAYQIRRRETLEDLVRNQLDSPVMVQVAK